ETMEEDQEDDSFPAMFHMSLLKKRSLVLSIRCITVFNSCLL
ncbi:MAG: hypothetical protein RL060_1445, partial [Bacteroidota bacterium]